MQKKITTTDKIIVTIIFQILHYTILYLAYIPLSAFVLISFVFCVIPVFSLLQGGENILTLHPLFSQIEDISLTESDILMLFSKMSFFFSSIAVVFQFLTKKQYSDRLSFSNKKKILIISSILTILMIISQITILNTGTTKLVGILIFFWALALVCYFLHIVILWFATLFSLFQSKVLADNL
ncbi:MAG: hypothetical protein CO156_05305 [Candidatus Pacebacteria bacterium CG_4_9_14_3_um_filter_40_12]|nr:hypothetical protein [Candidatus Paceibacterota bacterium]PIR63662.1 MAG: hypothetical protein COU64_03640 [Candidatus Pacebacteria bacterium CG10_big_fil_rev_8_21_14_0_10_40_26]PIZ78765.1 MAG: hypothetical protein COY01_04010 [Candidatus Pacebacteria bacterium CG_4_10_14_0_2_um_filter_40_20]PJA68384.1 MAG: hypothetical protein CO156_05305 [Candidatus Pacebacteria bacterium CG_4_9_14_3_um_filter_40_12]PJC41246.1 MAG: hypothetical protein CO041_05375 [Candidatus Pacebacteria bacterium CG_4_9_